MDKDDIRLIKSFLSGKLKTDEDMLNEIANMHITFREIDDIENIKDEYYLYPDCSLYHMYVDGIKKDDTIYIFNCSPTMRYDTCRNINHSKYIILNYVKFHKHDERKGDISDYPVIIEVATGNKLPIKIERFKRGYIKYDDLYYIDPEHNIYFLPTSKFLFRYKDSAIETDNHLIFKDYESPYTGGTAIILNKKTGDYKYID